MDEHPHGSDGRAPEPKGVKVPHPQKDWAEAETVDDIPVGIKPKRITGRSQPMMSPEEIGIGLGIMPLSSGSLALVGRRRA